MNNNKEGDNRGASITPSSRRSIHSHRNTLPSSSEIMVRYGLNKKRVGPMNTAPPSEGIDEVDNVFSKFSHAISDLPTTHGKRRRNSSSSVHPPDAQCSDDDSDTDDDSHEVVSKSLPTYLPSYSPYRNASGQCKNMTYENSTSVKSFHSSRHNESTTSEVNASNNYFHYNSLSIQDEELQDENKKSYKYVIFSVLVIALAVCYSSYKSILNPSDGNHAIYYDEHNFYKDMNNLGVKYRISDDSILRVKSGISSITERSDTSSFIFVYDSQSDKFNYHSFNIFIEEIAHTVAKYLRNNSTSVNHLSLDGSKLEVATHGELVTKYRDVVTKTGVMLVKNIDKVPSYLAMAFHYYCDEYDPLARKSAIFFTLNSAQCYINTDKKSSHHSNIEKCLAKKWNTVPQDNIGPLLTRVVNIIVDVTNVI